MLIDICLNIPSIKNSLVKVQETLAGKQFYLPTNYNEATLIRNRYSHLKFILKLFLSNILNYLSNNHFYFFSLLSTLIEIKLALCVVKLPVLEPLTPLKLIKLCDLSLAILTCAVVQAAANGIISLGYAVSPKSTLQLQVGLKEDELESSAIELVEESLHFFKTVGNLLKLSNRAGGNVSLFLIEKTITKFNHSIFF